MIPVNEPLFCGNEKEYLNQCIDQAWISSEGPFVKKFEDKFSSYLRLRYGIAVCNGTAALEAALAAAGIGGGDEVIMPTFFGPTNIPYLEAFALGCPVVGSDIRGVREQIGNAGLLVNPNSPEDLGAAILKVWSNRRIRETLTKRGYNKIKSWSFERFSERLNKLIDEIEERLAGAG